jgi:putative ABC transport system ATP-binding protein
MEIIKTRGLTKTYQNNTLKVEAVKQVDLSISEGEFTAIVGPSGSGKTTLFNMIGGLDDITAGNVEIAGTNISNLKENELIDFRLKHIGFVFQAYNLIPVLTAKENVAFIMLLQGLSEKERMQRSEDLLEQVGLGDKFDSRPNQLSGGQQQRVAVARALASKPRFILADEPTANLDSISTAKLLDIMSRLNKQENITFIFSSHDQRVIDRARRVITLEDGKIITDKKK